MCVVASACLPENLWLCYKRRSSLMCRLDILTPTILRVAFCCGGRLLSLQAYHLPLCCLFTNSCWLHTATYANVVARTAMSGNMFPLVYESPLVLQELIRRWDSERELIYYDVVHAEASDYTHWTDILISKDVRVPASLYYRIQLVLERPC